MHAVALASRTYKCVINMYRYNKLLQTGLRLNLKCSNPLLYCTFCMSQPNYETELTSLDALDLKFGIGPTVFIGTLTYFDANLKPPTSSCLGRRHSRSSCLSPRLHCSWNPSWRSPQTGQTHSADCTPIDRSTHRHWNTWKKEDRCDVMMMS